MKLKPVIMIVTSMLAGKLFGQLPPDPGTELPSTLSLSLTDAATASTPLALTATGFDRPGEVAVVVYHASW